MTLDRPSDRLVRSACRTLLAVAVLVLAAAPAAAQANLEVAVSLEDTGAPVAGVEVDVTNPATGYAARLTTDQLGRARFPALPTGGPYTVTAVGPAGFGTSTATDIILRTSFDRSVRLVLRPSASFAGEVQVLADRQTAVPNTVNAEVSATLVERELRALPVEGRDLTRALYRLPNVTQATGFYPEAPNVSINGANALYTNYMIDGLENNEGFLGGQKFAVPTGFVQDVTVLTSSFSAEFGRTGNGIFNVTTKSGSNELHGEAYYLSRPGEALDASSSYAGRDLSGNAVKDGFERHQAGLALGGPLARDRTFYFVDAEWTRDEKDNVLSSPRLGIADTVPGTNEFRYLSGRFDHRWSTSVASAARLNWGDVEIERQGGGLDGGVIFPEAGSTQNRDSALAALSTTWVHSDMYNRLAVQHSRFDWGYVDPVDDARPGATVLGADELPAAILGHPGWTFDEQERTWQLQDKLELMLGDHTLKVGAEAIHSEFELYGGGNSNGNYLVRLTEAQEAQLAAGGAGAGLSIFDLPADVEVLRYDVELRPRAIRDSQQLYSVYLEDQWLVTPRLTLSAGLRWDLDTLSKGGGEDYDEDNVSPRLSANYQIDDRSVVRAGFGVFYDKIVYAIHSDALQQSSTADGFRWQLEQLVALGLLPAGTDLDRITYDGNLAASFGDVDFLDGPTPDEVQGDRDLVISNERRILNPDGWDNPRTTHYSLGYQRRLTEDSLLTVDLIYTRAKDLPRLTNLNAPAPYPLDDPDEVVVRTPDEADATRPVPIVDGGARSIIMTEMAGEARYRAATVTLVSQPRELWAGRISYTLSELENDSDDINFRAEDSNNWAAEWGPSVNDRTHVINGLLQVFPGHRWTVSLAALVQSGQPINRIPDATIWGTTDLNGDGRAYGDAYVGNSDRWPGEPRNSDRLPWSSVWDLGLAYRVPVGGGELELRVDVFNLFNESNYSGYSNNATQSNQIQVGPADSGYVVRNTGPRRQFQLGVRFVL